MYKERQYINYSRQDVRIHTQLTDETTIANMAKPIIDWADKHGVYINLGWDNSNCLVATYDAEGNTSAYCRGMVAEINQMLKDTFHCKIDVMFYAY